MCSFHTLSGVLVFCSLCLYDIVIDVEIPKPVKFPYTIKLPYPVLYHYPFNENYFQINLVLDIPYPANFSYPIKNIRTL